MAEDESILNTTKKILGVGEDQTAFDLDIVTHINSAFSTLNQLGIGPTGGFFIDSAEEKWSDFGIPQAWLRTTRAYTFLKVKSLFDPPATSFHIDALERQIKEHEVRLMHYREELIPVPTPDPPPEEEPVW